MASSDHSVGNNDNKYNGGYFCIKDGMLFTTQATIPLANISKIRIGDISRRIKLVGWFWACLILGILGIGSGSEIFVVPGFISFAIAVAYFVYFLVVNSKNEYALCIESDSGSVEMYTSPNMNILLNALYYLEQSIGSLSKGMTLNGTTFNVNNGQISNDLIIHGNNLGSAVTGTGNTSSN